MRTAIKSVLLLMVLVAGPALAEDKAASGNMSQVKSMAMKERHFMMDKTKAIDVQVADIQKSVAAMDSEKAKALSAQVAQLQANVKALEAQLAKTPKYFDDPTADPLRP